MCLFIRMRVYNTSQPAPDTVNKAENVWDVVFAQTSSQMRTDGSSMALLFRLLLLLLKRYAPRVCNIFADRRELGQK